MRLHRFTHRIRTFLQTPIGLARLAALRIQCDDAINCYARVLGDLPFLPGDVKIDRGEIFPRRGLFGQERDKRAELPAGTEIIGCSCPGGVAAGDVIARVGHGNVRKNPGLNHLRDGEATAIANGAQCRI